MTPHAAADARLAIFDSRRGRQLGLLGALVTVMFGAIFIIGGIVEINETDLISVSVDFYVFWAAAKLALQGLPLDAFDVTRIAEMAAVTHDDWMPWAYPPGFLLLVMPLGLLPFAPAWAVFMVLSCAALLLATRPFTAGRTHVLLGTALAPAILPCLLVGQTTILWLAGLMAALAALRAEKPLLAGIFIGLLTLKPQLGLLIPFALIAAGQWRAILSAAVTTLLLAAIPTVLFGTAYWPEMLAMMREHGDTVRNAIADLNLMISAYAALVYLGLAEATALAAQWVLTALCAAAVFLTWRRPSTSFELRAATLLCAIPLASPYLWHYESALLAPAALFLARAGIVTPGRPLTVLLGIAMWLSLGPSALVLLKSGAADVFRPVFLPLALAALLTCLWHALLRPRPAATPATPEETH